ncbi:MAG: MTAP family purine nucleoside phosphorylase [Planctomycetaceae bacterium]|nr:MTAP family purine nucleoside phosphorylase [Planctomycetaceae bacterium]
MAATLACIAGEEVYRQWQAGHIAGTQLGPRKTPFGNSGEIFLVAAEGTEFYLLPRYGAGMDKTAPCKINSRANMYALKDLGVNRVVAWGPGGTITHNIAVGDLVILTDLLDLTHRREATFFEDSPLGFLRQFPVFCPSLRKAAGEALHAMRLVFHGSGTAAVSEGPRLETPAEIRMLSALGAEVATHTFVPEVFLAKELQMCYAAVCYVVNYAEGGLRHKPFAPGTLFGGLSSESDHDRVAGAVSAMTQTMVRIAHAVDKSPPDCTCEKTMQHNIEAYGLDADWHTWFGK